MPHDSNFWKKFRRDFPITKNAIYLDHASGGPIPLPVLKQIQTYYREHSQWADFSWKRWITRREEVRTKVASFINADPDEITFIQSTSQGMNWISELISGEGSVLTNTCEFPSSTLPWIWKKSDIVWQKPDGAALPVQKLRSLLSPKIKTILTSYVQYATGFRQDLKSLGAAKGNRFFVVNATQAFGAMPIDVKAWNIDFLVTNSYKWLMAGYGGGVLYIRRKWLKKFKPSFVGWRSMENPEQMDNRLIQIKKTAGRYEIGCPSFPAIFAVGAAVEYLNQIGIHRISERIFELTDYLMRGLDQRGIQILSPRSANNRSGIVVFKTKHQDTLWKKIWAKKIYTSLRGEGIRVAPHFYNTYEELDALLKVIQ